MSEKINKDVIGSAEIAKSGTITLHLHTIDSQHPQGEAEITYDKQNPLYKEVMDHLIGAGHTRLVRAWAAPTPPVNYNKNGVLPDKVATNSGTNQAKDAPVKQQPPPEPAPPETPQFQRTVQDTVDKLPAGVVNLLKQHNVKLVGVRKVTDEAPELTGKQPRGWPTGSTWDDCDGVYDTSRNTVVVAYEHLDDWTGKWSPNSSVPGVLRHETGHAFNYTLGFLSNTPNYVSKYDTDAHAMPADAQKRLSYFLQPGAAGRDETAADTFAHIEGGTSFPSFDKDIGTYFPSVSKVVDDAINALPTPIAAPPLPSQSPVGAGADGSKTPAQPEQKPAHNTPSNSDSLTLP